jgi:hypothetical protein
MEINMSIGKIKWQSVVSKYAYPETWRSLWQVFNSVIPFFVLWYLAYRSLGSWILADVPAYHPCGWLHGADVHHLP